MADLALGGLERIIKACPEIKKAVETVQQNKKECRDIKRCVASVTPLLSWLKELTMDAVIHPSFTGALDDLEGSMDEALQLITDCQQKNALCHLLGVGDMARQLRRVQDDIQRKLATVILATSILQVQISVSVTNTLHYVGAHSPLLPQDVGRLSSNMSHSTTDDVRANISGSSSGIAMLTGGCERPYPSSSRTEYMLFEREDTAQHFSGENIAGGRYYFAGKQKIVIKLSMPSARSRGKVMTLTSKFAGVSSIGITGDGKDRLEVVGESVDVVSLINRLRKKIGYAEVEGVNSKENKPPMSMSPNLTARRETDDEDNQRFNYPFLGSSSDSEPPSSSPRRASFKGKGKQTLLVAQPHHQEVKPHVAAPAGLDADGPSQRGIMAHIRPTAPGLKASRLPAVHEWLVAIMPAYGLIFVFVFAFLFFLRTVTSSNFEIIGP